MAYEDIIVERVDGWTEISINRPEKRNALRMQTAQDLIDALLEAEADASFVVVAQGSTPMGGVWGSKTPWALASAILLDVDQEGWNAPNGSLD